MMGSFSASLKTVGDRQGLPATISVEDGRISIAAGEAAIGEWALEEISLEPIPTGYRLAAEGEQILLEMSDSSGFADEISKNVKQAPFTRFTGLKSAKQRMIKTGKGTPPEQSVATAQPTTAAASPSSSTDQPPADTSQPARAKDGGVIGFVDRAIASAERRWSALLPRWVFTRAMVGVVAVTLIAAVVFPGLVATLLLLGGVLLVTFGAIVYSDNMLASRWLPGRTTPIHVLLFGVAVLVFGVLLAVVAG